MRDPGSVEGARGDGLDPAASDPREDGGLDLEQAERVMVAAVGLAGRTILRRLNRLGPMEWDRKGSQGLVTRTDHQIEERLHRLLREQFPGPGFWGEEGGIRAPEDRPSQEGGSLCPGEGWCWVLDPVDGTTNFVHAYPMVAVSLALCHRSQPQVGVVYDPSRRELFTARKGKGARLNGRPIRASAVEEVSGALLCTGFGHAPPQKNPLPYRVFGILQSLSHGVRRDGCASLDLCYVACGRLDGFWEWDLKPWDVAAGGLVLREAGGRWTDLEGAEARIDSGDFLASNGKLHADLLRRLEQAR